MSEFNPLNILIVQEEAEKYANLIKERFPQKVANGEINLMLALNEVSLPDNVLDTHIIGTWPLFDELAQMPDLQWVMTFSSGVDHWEKWGKLPSHVPLVHLPGGSGIPVAEFTIGLMLNLTKKYNEMWDNQKVNKYDRIQGGELYGKTLGIIGLGGIGREIAKRAKAFDMHVIGTEIRIMDIPCVDEVYLNNQFEKVLQMSDFVVLSCPETSETLGMMNEDRFKMMKKTAYFINCARGSLVIKEALIKALEEGWIAGAANDTHWIKKPLPSYLPPDDELWNTKNLIITPHVSSWTDMYAQRFGAIFVENIARFINGEPLVSVAPGFAAPR
ncbi:D-2-hydroxyacid dehydrogenase [Desulfoscipio gibsoniae]|uniref:Phosphoglycerate dehydrogenase-like oxidoreductase n=1 Tax=Desulfoscipio gibsoniae DSM 7213 TaxID=767817 RepID=R4KE94_9FIRM|nr:D-2-hydroxyacid dehydrogenase [Desulfoscipio gibsoniae]AGL00909.1 phosphoglycerate dehydrogenase-like oxidoreductase [Desulfoscipio gibsoniae DSM 7213]